MAQGLWIYSGDTLIRGLAINRFQWNGIVLNGGDATGTQGVTFTVSGSHTDPGSLDTFTYRWTLTRDGYPVDLTGYATTESTFPYTPTEPGTYAATLTGTDEQGDDWFLFNSVGGPAVDQATDLSAFEDVFDRDL